VRVVALCDGQQLAIGGAQVDVLAPPRDYVPARVPRNNDSLVLRLRHGRHVFLLSGDVDRQIERGMLASGELGRVDVLKVAHHGSKTSSTAEFLDAVQPAFALISTGAYNSYGHPHPDTIERLHNHHTWILRTDEDGLVSVRSDGKRLAVETNRWRQEVPRLIAPF